MEQFEYELVENKRLEGFDSIKDRLNELGSKGWELCEIDFSGHFVLKRKIMLYKQKTLDK